MNTPLPYLTRAEIDATGYSYSRLTATQAAARSLEPRTVLVETLFESLPEDGTPVVRWTGFGHVQGVEMFSSHIMRRNGDRAEVMRSNDGTVVMVYAIGLGRTVRTLVKSTVEAEPVRANAHTAPAASAASVITSWFGTAHVDTAPLVFRTRVESPVL